jgi:hypothetical protein
MQKNDVQETEYRKGYQKFYKNLHKEEKIVPKIKLNMLDPSSLKT